MGTKGKNRDEVQDHHTEGIENGDGNKEGMRDGE